MSNIVSGIVKKASVVLLAFFILSFSSNAQSDTVSVKNVSADTLVRVMREVSGRMKDSTVSPNPRGFSSKRP